MVEGNQPQAMPDPEQSSRSMHSSRVQQIASSELMEPLLLLLPEVATPRAYRLLRVSKCRCPGCQPDPTLAQD